MSDNLYEGEHEYPREDWPLRCQQSGHRERDATLDERIMPNLAEKRCARRSCPYYSWRLPRSIDPEAARLAVGGAWQGPLLFLQRTCPPPEASTEEVLAWSDRMSQVIDNTRQDIEMRRAAGL